MYNTKININFELYGETHLISIYSDIAPCNSRLLLYIFYIIESNSGVFIYKTDQYLASKIKVQIRVHIFALIS